MDYLEEVSLVLKTSGHKARLEILSSLKEGDKSAKNLSELFGTSQTYVHRHLQTMVEGGLVEKRGKDFTLSTVGRIIVNSLGYMETIINYKDFWEGHSISQVPGKLLEEMIALKNTKIITPAPRVIDKMIEMISASDKRILAAADRLPEITFTETRNGFVRGVEVYVLMGDIPPQHIDLYKNVDIPKGVKIRTTAKENLYMGVLVIDNKEAGIIFPDKNGVLDWNAAIYGKNPEFVSWVEKNFRVMFNKGRNLFKVING